MEYLMQAINFILHLDKYLTIIISHFGLWIYGILFFVIFLETGLVVMPFLPGDLLLFATGTFAVIGQLQLSWLIFLLFLVAFFSDTVNYWIGYSLGHRLYRTNLKLIKKEHLLRTQKFYENHGGKAIFLARFIPIIRTFAPFIAGVGIMTYGRFIMFN
mgnify:CR=1 FL=1